MTRNYKIESTRGYNIESNKTIFRQHLYLGTAKIQFFNSEKRVVDQINILEPFYLRVSVWNGQYDKNDNPKYEFSEALSKILFELITVNEYPFSSSEMEEASTIANKTGKQKQLNFFQEESEFFLRTYSNATVANRDSLLDGDGEVDEGKLSQLLDDYPYFKQFDKTIFETMHYSMYKTGMAMRYRAKFNEEFNFNPYLYYYFKLFNGFCVDGVITGQMIKEIVIDNSDYSYHHEYIENWYPTERGEFLFNLANSWTEIAKITEDAYKDDSFIKELLSSNPKIPTFLISDYLSKRKNMIHYLTHIYESSNITAIAPATVKIWGDDEEICCMLLEDFYCEKKSQIYKNFSEQMKSSQAVLSKIDPSCFKYIPKTLLSDKKVVLDILQKIRDGRRSGNSHSILRYLGRDLRENPDVLKFFISDYDDDSDWDGYMDLFAPSLFSKDFVTSAIFCGAKYEKKDDINHNPPKLKYGWLLLFDNYTNDIKKGEIDISTPFIYNRSDFYWKNIPKYKGALTADKIENAITKGNLVVRYNKSSIFLDKHVIEALERKPFLDNLTVALNKSKEGEGTTRSGRSKI